MKLNIDSAIENSTGYTLKATFYKRSQKVLETGLILFSLEEALNSLSEMNLVMSLKTEQFVEFCEKLGVTSENLTEFFYFFTVYIQLFNSYKVPIREFSSYVNTAALQESSLSSYRLISFQAYPLPWFMQKSTNYRVYIHKKVEDIIKDIFSDFQKMSSQEFAPVFKITKAKDTSRINCIQNGESDWDFILRLLDEEDWSFFFRHKEGKHEFIIYDDIKLVNTLIENSKNRTVALNIESNTSNLEKSETNPLKELFKFQNDRISNIQFFNAGAPISFDTFDSDHRAYGKVIAKNENNAPGDHLLKAHRRNGFEGAKKYKNKDALKQIVSDKNESLQKKTNSLNKYASGRTNATHIYLGALVTAKYSEFDSRPASSSVLEISSFRVEKFQFVFSIQNAKNFNLYSELVMHPETIPYAVEHDYERNYIDGTMTAKVFGKEYELYLDKDYFIKVQLPWQYDKYSDKAEFIYARYMSPWANKKYGFFGIPRGLEEVLVVFEDGDPDLPIIIGGVYNEKRAAPVDIKTKKHVLAIYDQPAANKKNNFFQMDHKTATVDLAAAEHMRIRSFGDHLTQSKLMMSMITAKNMLSKSKEEMEFKTEKNMYSEAKEQMECKTDKFMLHEAKEHMEFKADKHMLHEAKEFMESKTDKYMRLESLEQMELSTQKNFSLQALEDIEIKTDKNIIEEAVENIKIKAGKEVTITVGTSVIKLTKEGNITVTGKKISIKGQMGEIDIE